MKVFIFPNQFLESDLISQWPFLNVSFDMLGVLNQFSCIVLCLVFIFHSNNNKNQWKINLKTIKHQSEPLENQWKSVKTNKYIKTIKNQSETMENGWKSIKFIENSLKTI